MRTCQTIFIFFSLLFSANFSKGATELISDTTNTTVDSASVLLITDQIVLIGNKITKPRIIYRELTFKAGDTISLKDISLRIKRSEENLHNTSLFNSVKITWLQEKNKVNFYILVTERWYVFPLPIFEIAERNFNVWWETKDFSRVIYGGTLNWYNFRGRNEVLAVTARLGYTQRLSFYYSLPALTKGQKSGLTFSLAYSRNHQTSISTQENKIVYYKDSEIFTRREAGGSIVYSYRPGLNVTHNFEVAYRHADVEDTVVTLNPNYFAGSNEVNYTTLRYFLKIEHRDLAVYPLKGNYFDIELIKNGLGFLNDDIDLSYAVTHYKHFWPLSKRFHAGAGLSAKYSFQSKMPYYFTKGLGYSRDFIRGYEYYVMDGEHFALMKTGIKFTLLPKKEVYASFIPLNKFATIPFAFYLNLFSDFGYVSDSQFKETNFLNNSWQYGYGAGIDFVTYYDMIFRLEFSRNKLGESGFFLHFTSPI
ncbi:MAG: hypothetical protein KA284_01845 [Bacteroidia bacterium]|mgnify:CR=1 FL=1|nr:hypothetical protein [Bacteroidia bacterium]